MDANVPGMDLAAIRRKYQNGDVNTQANPNVTGTIPPDNKVKDFIICPKCNGLGIIKVTYNHMVNDRDCDKCDGESIIRVNQS